MNFRQFLYAYREGKLDQDAAWRAYDILAIAGRSTHVRSALKALGMAYAGEHAMSEFMARYEVWSPDEARVILGAWWLWSGISAGRRMGVPLISAPRAEIEAPNLRKAPPHRDDL
jgi:hypothetical protein